MVLVCFRNVEKYIHTYCKVHFYSLTKYFVRSKTCTHFKLGNVPSALQKEVTKLYLRFKPCKCFIYISARYQQFFAKTTLINPWDILRL